MNWESFGLGLAVSFGTLIGCEIGQHIFKTENVKKLSLRVLLCGLAGGIIATIIYTAPNWIAALAK